MRYVVCGGYAVCGMQFYFEGCPISPAGGGLRGWKTGIKRVENLEFLELSEFARLQAENVCFHITSTLPQSYLAPLFSTPAPFRRHLGKRQAETQQKCV